MARRAVYVTDFPAEVAAIKALLDGFLVVAKDGSLRDRVRSLVPAVHRLRDVGSSQIPRTSASAALDRIEFYLRAYPQTLIEGDELLVVSGIGEWARRVRELRVEFGWWIYSGVTIREMVEEDDEQLAALREMLGVDPMTVKPDQYVLVRSDQDREAALRWNILNGIRKRPGGVKSKLIEYFRANVGRVVSGEELRYVAGDKKEWARRSRELRTEDGWPVFTKMQGRPEIPVGAYLLDEDKQAEPHDRKIADDTRVRVLQRDQFRCSACGWDRSQLTRDDPRKFLEVHHLQEHAKGGSNEAENLVALCNVHHDVVHRGELALVDGVWMKINRMNS